MKSKTPRTSKSSAQNSKKQDLEFSPQLNEFASEMAVGHHPPDQIRPHDEALFRAFQSNLLSLISHELRTPLMGILNSLTMLEDPEALGEINSGELIGMARRNAERLQRTLSALLDLASIESGTFHARLREVDLSRLTRSRLQTHELAFQDHGMVPKLEIDSTGTPILADPQKLGRAIDLCLDLIASKAVTQTAVSLKARSTHLEFQFFLKPELKPLWEAGWTQALAGHQSGVLAPGSAFAGTMQSEQAFLTRMEEGLGSEFLLIHEIMRLHRGSFAADLNDRSSRVSVTLHLELPELSSDEGLVAVLTSRTTQATFELSSVALALIRVPANTQVEEFRALVKKGLFRSTDAVYALPDRKLVALVMDDCKPEDVPRLVARIEKVVGASFKYGVSTCPAEGFDPEHLFSLAEKRANHS